MNFLDDYAYGQLELARQHLLDVMQRPGISAVVQGWQNESMASLLQAQALLEEHLLNKEQ